MNEPQPPGAIPSQPGPAPVPPENGQAFQPWDAVPDNHVLERYNTLEAAKGQAAFTWGAVPGPELIPLFNPKDAPCKGMFSSLHPSSLDLGQYALIQNLRFDDETFTARPPTIDRVATGLPTGAGRARGLWCGSLNGTQYVLAAVFDGVKIGVYVSTDGTAFVAVTATTGAYGDTRMTDLGTPVVFGVLTDPVNTTDYVVILNGADVPRVYSAVAVNTQKVFSHKSITAPTVLSAYPPKVSVPCKMNLTVAPTVVNTGATFAGPIAMQWIQDYTGGPYFVTGNLGVDTAGDTCVITFATPVNWTSATQMCFAFGINQSAMNAFLVNRYKVEVWDTVLAAYQTIFDPTLTTNINWYEVTDQTASATNWRYVTLFTFDISALTRTSISKVRLTAMYTGTYFAGQGQVWLAAIFGGTATGAWQLTDQSTGNLAGASYTVAYANSASRAESAGVTLSPVKGFTPLWTDVGGQDLSANAYSYGSSYVSTNHKVLFNLQVPFSNPSTTDRDAGVDTLNVYRQDLGSSEYLFAFSASLATWGGAVWAYVNTGSTTGIYYTSDTSGAQGLNVSRLAPDGYTLTMPAGNAFVAANGRTMIGSKNAVWLSEYLAPFRFRPYLKYVSGQPQARSAAEVLMAGESVVAFGPVSASSLGASTVICFTDKRVLSFSGFDGYALSQPNCLAAIGCSAPGSVQVYKDVMFFLDTQGQLRRFSYGHAHSYMYANANSWELMHPISRRVVDDRTKGIPIARLPWVSSAIYGDRYYMAITPPAGADNTRILIWDEYITGFLEDTVTSEVSLATGILGGNRLLLGQGSDGKVYNHEDPTSVTVVPAALTFPEIHSQMWASRFFGSFGMVADVQAGVTANIAKTCKPNQTDATTIDMASAAVNQVWRWDNRSGYPGGQRGVSCQIALTLNMTPGTKIYSMVLETQGAAPGPDR